MFFGTFGTKKNVVAERVSDVGDPGGGLGASGGPEALDGCSVEVESGVRIRRMEDVDLGRIRKLRSVVRWATDPSTFDLLRGMRDVRWSVAETQDGVFAGMIGAVPLGRLGIVCHLAVRDENRGRGVGAKLSRWAVAYLRSRGAEKIRLYSTPRAENLYRSAGFRPVTPRVIYRLEGEPENSWVENADYGVETLGDRDLSEVCGVDLWTGGADRSALLTAILQRHPEGGLVAKDPSGRVKGYLIRCSVPGSVPGSVRIGPFMASDICVARDLLSEALKRGSGSVIEVTVTGPEGDAAHDLFREFGFTGTEGRLRMELGEERGRREPGLHEYGTTPYLAT